MITVCLPALSDGLNIGSIDAHTYSTLQYIIEHYRVKWCLAMQGAQSIFALGHSSRVNRVMSTLNLHQ